MSVPLYLNHEAPSSLNRQMHAGLWWNKFFNRYGEDLEGRPTVPDQAKAEWISSTARNCPSSPSKAFLKRQLRLGHHLRASRGVFQTEWHFVTGTGLSHPVENGFAWHPTLGLPYLPGSSVKGLLRAWIEEWSDGDEEQRAERLRSWFGSNQDDEEKAGDLIFFDALPVEGVELAPDIITPHMGQWYEQGGNIRDVDREPDKVPADWHSPIPIHFLVVKQGLFLFQIAPRGRTLPVEAQEAMAELEQALLFLGAGAKTAVGYGHMHSCELPENFSDVFVALEQEAQAWALSAVADLELVSMIAAPAGNRVQVRSQDQEDEFECRDMPTDEARERWERGECDFLALVTRRGARVLRAVRDDW